MPRVSGGKTETIKERTVYIYLPSLEMVEDWKRRAEGADILSIESIGGKEVFNYSIIRQDIEGILFSVGILRSLNMEFLWAKSPI
ncbi:MAG: methyltransferase MtaB domain-containing protein [Candidatus Bathyarchaeia archaeon]